MPKVYLANRSLLRWLLMLIGIFLILGLIGCQNHFVGVLNPKGLIAHTQRTLFFNTLALMLIVVLPVIVMSFTFVYHYQVSHRIKTYRPNWSHSLFLEALWWGIPIIIIIVLAVLTWKRTYQLDPYRRIVATEPLQIQAIALPWKWLFIYPKQNIAAINYLVIPVNKQVEFWFTTDNVPMSAFFIPQLGSQIYTMAGMRTRLHILATQTGNYEGLNTQYNGEGFSDMHFPVYVMEADQLQQWFQQIKKSTQHLTDAEYQHLLNPSIANPPQFYSGVVTDLFQTVIATYMNSVGTIHPRSQQGQYYLNQSHKE
jgi:cytochrome o ubiquinol oxidase subunit II